MRKLLLLALSAAGVFTLQARQLTPTEALARITGVSAPSRSGDVSLVYTADDSTTGQAGVYVFNRGTDNGFLIVSADDAAEALLGYADGGSFDPADMPPALRAWIEEYTRQVAWASTSSVPSRAASAGRPARASIAPMCKTQWNQSAPYNNLCPTAEGSRCVTGCVATAMAQVMKYHNYPTKGVGSHSYTTPSLFLSASFNFGATTFDWANMLDSYTSTATSTQKTAVATLMLAAGVSVDMDYTPSSSGASVFAPGQALIEYFNYDKGITYQSRSWYGLYDWENLIYDNLKTCGPVILGGQSGEGGHEFVCDGYSKDGYFHINWGWGGMSNGYFLLTALDPGSQGIGGSSSGYNFNQDAIVGIRPAVSGSTYNPVMVSRDDVTGEGKNSTLILRGFFMNKSYCTLNNIDMGVEINGHFYKWDYLSTNLESDMGITQYQVSLKGLPAGTYQVRPAFKCDGSDWQLMKAPLNCTTYINITVSSTGNITVTRPADVFNVKIEDVKLLTPLSPGNLYKLSAVAKNLGTQEYVGPVSLYLRDSQNNRVMISNYSLDAVLGEDTPVSVEATLPSGIPAGTYSLYFARVIGSQETVLSTPINVTVENYVPSDIFVDAFSIDNDKAVALDNITVNLTISNAGGYFFGPITAVIFPISGNQSVGEFNSQAVEIPAKAKDFKFSFSIAFPDGVVGQSYDMAFYNGQTGISYPQRFTVGSQSGIGEINADDVTSIEVYTPAGVRVPVDVTSVDSLDSSSLPAGLYIIVTSTPTSRTSVKYVKK